MMKTTYSEAFKEQALQKVCQRGHRSVQAIADELNVNYFTLKGWMKKTLPVERNGLPQREKRAEEWSLDERHAGRDEALLKQRQTV